MSKRHLFDSADGLVNKCLRGLVSYNPSLALDETNRVVYDTRFDKSKVSIISGGGSGHEPAWSGYVGTNLLSASVAGDIFASPSTRQIMSAIERVPSDKGTILVVTNYTGDCLHFGLATEKARSRGHDCRIIMCGDDVSVGRKGKKVGRRGLAGQLGVLKVMGGAAGTGASTDDVYDLGVAFADQIVSIAATLDHCHVPGRSEHAALAADEVELGTGPHNEPGYSKISPAPSPSDLVAEMLRYCLDEADPERGYVKFAPGDETFLLVSNFGGMSHLEVGALVDELLTQLEASWRIKPSRVYAGFLETSLNAPAFSISVVNVTAAAAKCSYSVDDIKSFADAKTDTYWESMAGAQGQGQGHERPREEQFVSAEEEQRHAAPEGKDVKVDDPAKLERMLRKACEDVIAAEPDLTRWDTIMGDGDCGETVKTVGSALLSALDAGVARSGSLDAVLAELEDIVESKIGGTLGGVLGIFFVSLRLAIQENASLAQTAGQEKLWAAALASALTNLRRYTPAAVGDRTIMDALIPFAEGMAQGGFEAAVVGAQKGAESTRGMKAQLGRATYVGGGIENKDVPPDPGAWAARVAVEGLKAGMQ